MPALWLCISVPTLLLDSLAGDAADQPPQALVAHHGPRRTVHSANAAARREGVRTGQAVSTALARVPPLHLIAHDPEHEAHCLERLALWAWQFSSQLSLAPPTALLLEIGASIKLFGSLQQLQDTLHAELNALGYRHRCGVAPTPCAARLIARQGLPPVCHAHQLDAALAPLPVQQLDLDSRTLRALQQCGIRTAQALFALPRDALARRFGPDCSDYLDRLRGLAPDPQPLYTPPEQFDQRLELLQEIDNTSALGFPLKRLIETLGAQLISRDSGTSELTLTLGHPRVADSQMSVRLIEASGSASHLLHLARTQLDRLQLPEPVRSLRLRCERFEAVARGADDLFQTPGRAAGERRTTVEHLRARLGEAAVYQLEVRDDHRPECAWRAHLHNPTRGTSQTNSRLPQQRLPQGRLPQESLPQQRLPPLRPLWLVDPPEPMPRGLSIESGPERLESGWWGGQCNDGRDAPDMRRDYYIARDRNGLRYWVFQRRDASEQWFVHGCFG